MFKLPDMLKIIATLYDELDVSQKSRRNEKLAYKDHKALIRHQLAYSQMTACLLEYIAPKDKEKLNKYISNTQRFFCTLHSSAFETELDESIAFHKYWRCIFSPMIATLINSFKDDKYNSSAIHFIGKLLVTWEEHKDTASRAKWVKSHIKESYNIKSPLFTEKINDIKGSYVQSRDVINKNLSIFEDELILNTPENFKEILSKTSATYHAAMIILRLEINNRNDYLTYIKNDLIQLNSNCKDNELLCLHEKIFNALLIDPDRLDFSWSECTLIQELDEIIFKEIEPTYPAFIDYFLGDGNDVAWPEHEKLEYIKSISLYYSHNTEYETPLSNALLDYYWMLYHIENNNLELAYNYCLKVEESSNYVHLGIFESSNIIHKIVLYYALHNNPPHNIFDTEITKLIMTLPDELNLTIIMNESFSKFHSSLNDNEMMILRSFSMFNQYHKHSQVNPFEKLINIINTIIEICENNEYENKIFTLNKKADKNIKRSKSVLSFSKKLSLSDGADMILELLDMVNINCNENIFLFINNKEYIKLLKEFDLQ